MFFQKVKVLPTSNHLPVVLSAFICVQCFDICQRILSGPQPPHRGLCWKTSADTLIGQNSVADLNWSFLLGLLNYSWINLNKHHECGGS